MHRRFIPRPTLRPALAAAAAALVLAACGGSTGTSSGGGGAGGATATLAESAHDFAFDSPALTVAAGASVTLTFTNNGSSTHSFTASDVGVDVTATGGSSQTATFTAPQSGSIAFHCKFHPSMTGTITVAGSSAAAVPSASSAAGYGAGY